MVIISNFPPTPQERPRVTRFVTYDPSAPKKKQFLKTILNQLPEQPISEPIVIRLNFNFKRPKSHYTSKGELRKVAPLYHTSRPDIDNLVKFVLDALNKHLYQDDALVVSLATKKMYSEAEGIEINVKKLSEMETDEIEMLVFNNERLINKT